MSGRRLPDDPAPVCPPARVRGIGPRADPRHGSNGRSLTSTTRDETTGDGHDVGDAPRTVWPEESLVHRSQLERVLDALARESSGPLPARMCAAAARMLASSGVGIAMVTDDGHLQTVWAVGLGLAGEELQLTTGEGPTYAAYRRGQPVLVDDLAHEEGWPMLGRDAGAAGIRAIFSFPLRSGAAEFGALTLYRDQPGPLEDGQYGDALVFARVALDLLLTAQEELGTGDLNGLFTQHGSSRWQVHQAAGMVSVQLGISLKDATAMLRAEAFSSGRSLSETAGDVVAGRLQLEGGS